MSNKKIRKLPKPAPTPEAGLKGEVQKDLHLIAGCLDRANKAGCFNLAESGAIGQSLQRLGALIENLQIIQSEPAPVEAEPELES